MEIKFKGKKTSGNVNTYARHHTYGAMLAGNVPRCHVISLEVKKKKKKKSHDSVPSLSLTHLSYLFAGSTGTVVMRINSMPSIGTLRGQAADSQSERSVVAGQTQSEPPVPLEVGSLVEVVNNAGVTVYGVIRWLGIPDGKPETWAGLELVRDSKFA